MPSANVRYEMGFLIGSNPISFRVEVIEQSIVIVELLNYCLYPGDLI